ncbi:hypothetical protein FIA58_008415 [Flavobacterium jejuense]|uniref:Lipoprotein n=1 Tax=Flavobacterium jejuense TaxID=1544455 RepID=A0ABX0IPG7_9FLAO|nr:hypothetical protein [Flavobacterium jejuense]NHN25700.1 hypothetical protein [Flavobacterium jejuense]
MRNIFIMSILIINFSCSKDDFIVNPRSVKESKERNAFIKEFVGDNSIITINNNKYLLKEIYLSYKIDSKKVHKQAMSLIFKTIDFKTQKLDCPDDYTKFELIVGDKKYDMSTNSRNLVSTIPINTSNFTLIYYDKKIKNSINFKEK